MLKDTEIKTNMKIDITSTAVEKGIDIARDFLNKLIGPAIEETGLLIKDQVTYIKFKNQIKILNKARAHCEKNNISPKVISLKLLCPLLENAALEEDEYLQNKWAILLCNLVDSSQNIENHVFPYILSQISKNEYMQIEGAYKCNIKDVSKWKRELIDFIKTQPSAIADLENKIAELSGKIKGTQYLVMGNYSPEYYQLSVEKQKLERELFALITYKEQSLMNKITKPIVIKGNLKEFEIANITRLGLIKEEIETYASSQTLEIPNEPERSHFLVDLDVEVQSEKENCLTELGKLFLQACNEKNDSVPPAGSAKKPLR